MNTKFHTNKFFVYAMTALLITAIFLGGLGTQVASAQTNLLTNPGFESGASQTPTGWLESGTVAASKSDAGGFHSGSYQGTHWSASAYTVYTYQTRTGLTNGTYTLRAWVRSGGGQTTAQMEAKNCGSAQQNYAIPTTSTWVQITLPNISVTNNQCTIGFYSVAAANQWINIDDVEFFATTAAPTPTTPSGSGLTMRGADVSSLRRSQDLGQVYYNASGTAQNPLIILKNAGVNYVRLRVWNNPASGYNNEAKVLLDAAAAKAQGLKVMIDFHYSDTWADPGKQYKPAAWASHNITQLQTDVYNFTLQVCNDLKAQGSTPDSAQIGNEINVGMLWDTGKVLNNDFTNLSLLLKQGYNAIKACNTGTQVIIHTADADSMANARWFYDGIKAKGVNWDITGLSYYCFWHGTMANMSSVVADMKSRYGKPVIIAETAYLFTTTNADSEANSTNTTCSGYAATWAGQASNFKDVQTAARNGGAIGVFYWEPTWVAIAGNGWDPANMTGTGNQWDNMAIFDWTGHINSGVVWTP